MYPNEGLLYAHLFFRMLILAFLWKEYKSFFLSQESYILNKFVNYINTEFFFFFQVLYISNEKGESFKSCIWGLKDPALTWGLQKVQALSHMFHHVMHSAAAEDFCHIYICVCRERSNTHKSRAQCWENPSPGGEASNCATDTQRVSIEEQPSTFAWVLKQLHWTFGYYLRSTPQFQLSFYDSPK